MNDSAYGGVLLLQAHGCVPGVCGVIAGEATDQAVTGSTGCS